MNTSDEEAYNELSLYTLAHGHPSFIHQHVVDAYAAQHADENSKPIKTAFALIGLYLMIEKGYTGKQVQNAHMQLAKHQKDWPRFSAPHEVTEVTVHDVLKVPAGKERDKMIGEWCAAVWKMWQAQHAEVAHLVRAELFREG
ncbi:MAG: DUF5946 family protein [Patescibacteria group bacterium]